MSFRWYFLGDAPCFEESSLSLLASTKIMQNMFSAEVLAEWIFMVNICYVCYRHGVWAKLQVPPESDRSLNTYPIQSRITPRWAVESPKCYAAPAAWWGSSSLIRRAFALQFQDDIDTAEGNISGILYGKRHSQQFHHVDNLVFLHCTFTWGEIPIPTSAIHVQHPRSHLSHYWADRLVLSNALAVDLMLKVSH